MWTLKRWAAESTDRVDDRALILAIDTVARLGRRLAAAIKISWSCRNIGFHEKHFAQFEIPANAEGEAILVISAYGLNAGNHLSVRVEGASEMVFEAPAGDNLTNWGAGSFKDSVGSAIRSTASGLRLEILVRALVGEPAATITFELPRTLLEGGTPLDVYLRKKWRHAVAVADIKLAADVAAPDQPVRNIHPIEGYCNALSFSRGDTVRFMVHSPEGNFSLECCRLGNADHCTYRRDDLPGRQHDYQRWSYRRGAGWPVDHELIITEKWRPGLYLVRLADNQSNEFFIPLIVKARPYGSTARILLIASSNTWEAYNSWGGASLYRYDLDGPIHLPYETIVSRARPNPLLHPISGAAHLLAGELHIYRWLEAQGYDYEVLSDSDLNAEPEAFSKYQVVIISTHSEYWTEAMWCGLERFLGGGGNLAYLSGNGLYWKTEIYGDLIEVRKAGGPHHLGAGAGGRLAALGKPASRLVGVSYSRAGVNTFAPYRVMQPRHWVFAGTGLEKGDLIGSAADRYQGASGHETDKIDRHSPRGLTLLARGTNPKRGGAHMTYYRHSGGGGVFAAGSIAFGKLLTTDPNLSRITRNVLDQFLNHQ